MSQCAGCAVCLNGPNARCCYAVTGLISNFPVSIRHKLTQMCCACWGSLRVPKT